MALQRLLVISTLSLPVAFAACNGEPSSGPVGIARIGAYFCAVRGAPQCQVRGDPIPAGQLPPTDEVFMVWAWHPGWNTTRWRVISPVAVDTIPDKLAQDSVGTWIALNGATAKRYTVRVQIIGSAGIVAQDSLVWNYP